MLKVYDQVELHHFTKVDDVLIGIDVEYTKKCDIGTVILEALNSKPNHVSQIDGYSEQSTTFAEMKDRSVRCALWLQKMGLGAGDIITYCMNNRMDAYIPIFATFCLGAIYNAWDDEVDLITAQRLMKLMRPKVIFAIEAAVEVLTEAARLENMNSKIVVFGKNSQWPSINEVMAEFSDEQVSAFRPVEVKNPKQTAVISFSSGSTGFPKGIVHSYEHVIKSIQLPCPYPMKDVAWWDTTPYWNLSISYVIQCVLNYGTRIIVDTSDTERVCQLIERYKMKRAFMTPRMAIAFQDYIKKYNCQSLQVIYVGGSAVPAAGLQRLKNMLPNTHIIFTYGMSEIFRACAAATDMTKCVGSVGFVGVSCQLKIVDTETGKTLGANQKGEIFVKSETMMIGYYNAGETDLPLDSESWLHTGDLGYYNDDGELFVIGRLIEVVKVYDMHVSAVEIEEHLVSHPDVLEAAVVFVPNLDRDHNAVAFVKRRLGAKVTKQDLIEFSSMLGKRKTLWGGVEFVDEMPLTPSGKVARFLLRKEALSKYSENN